MRASPSLAASVTGAKFAWRIASPLCRFRFENEPGWLELRDGLFRFYPGEVFDWRDAEPEGPGLLEDETGP